MPDSKKPSCSHSCCHFLFSEISIPLKTIKTSKYLYGIIL